MGSGLYFKIYTLNIYLIITDDLDYLSTLIIIIDLEFDIRTFRLLIL